ncbi:MAG: hypothetical protein IPK62_00225 [Bacteroidetes bacterium]|nr:hypothetical protein [Bacteroidota bacterium]MBK8143508.1 hypothetical protein [Bacteroidota bacterium]MBP6314449.1 hypothetical protein [Chitinophagaceae bacterium]
MKRLLKRLLFLSINPFFYSKFKAKISNLENVLLVDIDNTIAGTHEYLLENGKIEVDSIEPIANMKEWVLSEGQRKTVIYISARNYLLYGKTKKWLHDNGFLFDDNLLIMVLLPEQKIAYIEACLVNRAAVTLIDDMSFLNEKRELFFYCELIEKLRKLPIEYIGYEGIKKLTLKHD